MSGRARAKAIVWGLAQPGPWLVYVENGSLEYNLFNEQWCYGGCYAVGPVHCCLLIFTSSLISSTSREKSLKSNSSRFPESLPESSSSSSCSASNLDESIASHSRSCCIPDLTHCNTSTMSPLSHCDALIL